VLVHDYTIPLTPALTLSLALPLPLTLPLTLSLALSLTLPLSYRPLGAPPHHHRLGHRLSLVLHRS
jgi:hypothetical protein